METIKKYTKPEVSLLKIDMESMLDTASPSIGGTAGKGDSNNPGYWGAKQDNDGFNYFDTDEDEEYNNSYFYSK